jgi:hypothetical protein
VAVGTVPASTTWIIKQIILCNTNNALDANVSIGINGTAATAANCIFFNYPIAGNDTVVLDCSIVLATTETLNAIADRTGVNIVAYGFTKV